MTTPLTDEQIIRATWATFRRYRPIVGVEVAARIAAARMTRLYGRSAR